ncbi:MAG: histidine phosphatase family protein [Clostridia bacterium]|nr:histidine phosphatase family protein [Clostridia bacterium]
MKVYIIRHGESEANAKGIHSGQGQFALTEKGEKDAENVGELLRKIKFDKIYSSDLIRANMTGKIALPGHEIEQLSLIREVDVGWIVGRNIKALEAELGEDLINNKKNFDYRPYGGENSEMLMERAKKFLDKLAELGEECKNVAVFTHSGFSKAMLSSVMGVWIPINKLVCANCGVSVLSYEKGEWKLFSWNIQNNDGGTNVW